MTRFRIFLLGLSVSVLSHPVLAQPANGLWLSLNADVSINKKWNTEISQGLRFSPGIFIFNSLLTEVSTGFKAKKWLKVTGIYRFIRSRVENEPYSNPVSHRFSLQLRSDDILSRAHIPSAGCQLEIRLRAQMELNRYKRTESTLRLRSELSRDFMNNKLKTSIWHEVFFGPGRQLYYYSDHVESQSVFYQNRFGTGLDYELPYQIKAGVFFMIKIETQSWNNERIAGFGITWEPNGLPFKKKTDGKE